MDEYDGVTLKDSDDSFSIAVENLSFRYESAAATSLQNLSFEIPVNKSAFISGPPSSGKSTLMKILSGILEPTDGIIKYNGFPLRSLDFDKLKEEIGFCISQGEIFQGTILDNISLRRDNATPENINRALKITGLSPYLSKMPLGFNTIIDPEGKKVPTNIQKRILLARAIATNPRLLILEDPLDHVGNDEKKELISALTDIKNRWRVIISSVDDIWKEHIDTVIEINDGKIVSL